MCLCKDCDSTSILTWADLTKFEDVRLCICCGGQRFIHRNQRRCPNYRG